MNAPPWLTARPIAHRGLHGATSGRFENTLSAADAAVSGGYAIECDIQGTADGDVVVFHDHVLDRLTTEHGPVRAQAAAALGRMRIGGSADTVPTLSAFLDRIGGRVPLVIEVKSRFDGDEGPTRRMVEVLAGRDAPVVAKSFDPEVVALLRRLAPALPRGIVAEARYEGGEWERLDPARRHGMANLLHWDETRPDFVSWRHLDLPHAAPFFARRLAPPVPVVTWTVRSPAEAARALSHADQIVFEGFEPA